MEQKKAFPCSCGRGQIVLTPKVPKKKCLYCGTTYTWDDSAVAGPAAGETGAAGPPAGVAAKPIQGLPERRPGSQVVADVEYTAPGLPGGTFIGVLAFDEAGVVFACLKKGRLPRTESPSMDPMQGVMEAIVRGGYRGASIDVRRGSVGSGLSYFAIVKHCRHDPVEKILEKHPDSFHLEYRKIGSVRSVRPGGIDPFSGLQVDHEGETRKFAMSAVTHRRVVELFHKFQVAVEGD